MTYLTDSRLTNQPQVPAFQHPLQNQRPQFFQDLLFALLAGEICDSDGVAAVVDEAIAVALVTVRLAFSQDCAVDSATMKSLLWQIAAEILDEIGSVTVGWRMLQVRQIKSQLVSKVTDLTDLLARA
jgi:hypothetical protein